jgi:UDP-N-acetylmuramoyl-tripeptide--D-alanyl-D-alanine ligase
MAGSMLKKKIKRLGKRLLCHLLEAQVVRLRKRHAFIVVAVAGSIGKTSTKMAVAHMLEPTRRVIYQTGNYNDRLTVPLVLFGHDLPGLFDVRAWLRIYMANERTIRLPHYYDVAVVELGTDKIGDIAQFAYLKPDLSIVTAITAEHMSVFKTLDAVAHEELTLCDFSKQVLVNGDDTPSKYLEGRTVQTYGLNEQNDFRAIDMVDEGLQGTRATLRVPGAPVIQAQAKILGQQGVKILLASATAGRLLGLDTKDIEKGLLQIAPVAGRMQILPGIHGSTIIDDTYNASPEPVMAALDVLYKTDAPQRIAILGNMNELGDYSPEAHTIVGNYCNPEKLDMVVTIGPNAAKYLAPTAEAKGCTVKTFDNPYEAGKFVRSELQTGAVVLAEGSQNGVFAEEAIKFLLANKPDEAKLVRQSVSWLGKKQKQFGAKATENTIES